jgi:hypothetical protein
MHLDPGQMFCSFYRSNVRTAEVPTALNVEAQDQAEAVRLLNSMLEEFSPFGRAEHRTLGDLEVVALVGASASNMQGTAEALGLHLFEVA